MSISSRSRVVAYAPGAARRRARARRARRSPMASPAGTPTRNARRACSIPAASRMRTSSSCSRDDRARSRARTSPVLPGSPRPHTAVPSDADRAARRAAVSVASSASTTNQLPLPARFARVAGEQIGSRSRRRPAPRAPASNRWLRRRGEREAALHAWQRAARAEDRGPPSGCRDRSAVGRNSLARPRAAIVCSRSARRRGVAGEPTHAQPGNALPECAPRLSLRRWRAADSTRTSRARRGASSRDRDVIRAAG
jgi:hypothetical protein